MNHFNAHAIGFALDQVKEWSCRYTLAHEFGDPALPHRHKFMLEMVTKAQAACRDANFAEADRQIAMLLKRLEKVHAADEFSAIRGALISVRDQILTELSRHTFIRVDEKYSAFVDKDDLFGANVTARFPSAAEDLKNAGNALAVGLGTACVFHLMRAAEWGLRALATDRRLQFAKGTLDSKQWGEIIIAFDSYAGKLVTFDAKNWPSESVRQAQVRFYQTAVKECRAFNDAWRRHVSHAHDGAFYYPEQANSVMTHTRAFLVMLATKIGEHQVTPEFWTTA